MGEHSHKMTMMGVWGATGVGVGAIVGGGILALAGVCFATTGPSAMLAFGLNGVIAILTALSFAEMASKFPESGGTYTFSKKVLPVESAAAVGWVVWFASTLAGGLYALGFAHFALVIVRGSWSLGAGLPPVWLRSDVALKPLAVATIALLTVVLIRAPRGQRQWVNIGKVLVFALLIAGGLVACMRQPLAQTQDAMRPFFTAGMTGLVQAMGYTFIALQGFDLIAAVSGEVRDAAKTVPRAMVRSLVIALAIYLPLLFVITTAGSPVGQPIQAAAAADPEGIIAAAARNYLGSFGYWLVLVAAVMAMYSALQANLFAASRIARAMSRDHTLPGLLRSMHPKHHTPHMAILVTAALIAAIVLVVPDLSAAGAASSLMFLVSFALAHGLAMLIRRRSRRRPPPFRTPLYPLVPVLGGLSCLGLAVFQGIVVPQAGMIAVVWIGIGGILFLGLFARRARVTDVSRSALDPELITLRGRNPLVLVPIANPQSAESLIALANVLVPADVGRVLTHTVVTVPSGWQPDEDPVPFQHAQEVSRALLRMACRTGSRLETLTTVAPQPMAEIVRVARLHRCDSVLVGLSELSDNRQGIRLEALLSELDANVVALRSDPDWRVTEASNILVPVAGRGGHERLLVMLLGSILRASQAAVTFFHAMPATAADADIRRRARELSYLVDDDVSHHCRIEVVSGHKPVELLIERAGPSDLLILGVQDHGRRKKLFGSFTRQVAQRTSCPIIVISSRT